MKNTLLILVGIIMIACSTSAFSQSGGAFDKYNNRISMQCIGDTDIIQVSLGGDILTVGSGSEMPMSGKVGGEIVLKNGNREQYIMNFGFLEYFVDFEERVIVATAMGVKYDYNCY